MPTYVGARYSWSVGTHNWAGISYGAIQYDNILTDAIAGNAGVTLVSGSGFTLLLRQLSGGLVRTDVADHQLWVEMNTYGIGLNTSIGYTGLNGVGDVYLDAETLSQWIEANLQHVSGAAWPDPWYTPKPVPKPVVPVSPSPVEEADFGHLRTQFRRQSNLRRRNG